VRFRPELCFKTPLIVVGDVLNWLTWLAFVAELMIMLAVIPQRGRYLGQNPIDVAIVMSDATVTRTRLAPRTVSGLSIARCERRGTASDLAVDLV
jgi:hypothetical protein